MATKQTDGAQSNNRPIYNIILNTKWEIEKKES